MDLMDTLYLALVKSYGANPINDDLIGRIYDYAAWCFAQPKVEDSNIDLGNTVAVGLIENLSLDKHITDDLYRWFSVETFDGCEQLLRHHLSEDEYRKLVGDFMLKKRSYSKPSRL